MRPFHVAVTVLLLLGACAPLGSEGEPGAASGAPLVQGGKSNEAAAIATRHLDEFQRSTDQRRDLRTVHLGRTLEADELTGYYDGAHLIVIEAVYEGVIPTRYRAYISAAPTNGSLEAVFLGDFLRNGTERYYILANDVWALDEGAAEVRIASEREGHDITDTFQAYVETLERASRGIFDDPRAFEQE